MTVNGRELPASFAKFLEAHRYTNWDPKAGVDTNGDPLDTDFEPFDTVQQMEQNTVELARSFGVAKKWSPELLRSQIEKAQTYPGFIPYIEDFSKIVQFGRKLTGAPFCFDFRGNDQEPLVIHWEDGGCYWRQLAPSFDTFISLFERADGELYEEDEDETA
jgi:hypothetical protein